MSGENNIFSLDVEYSSAIESKSLDLQDIRAIISKSREALQTQLSQAEPQTVSTQDQTLLRMGQSDVSYAFTDTLEQNGIDHIDVDTVSLTDPRTALSDIYQTGDNLLRDKGAPSPDINFYHKAAGQAQESGQDMQDVLREMRSTQPLLMRADLDQPESVLTLPEGEVILAQAQDTQALNEIANANTSNVQMPSQGVFEGGTNYCTRSSPDVNLKDHSPEGNLVDVTQESISIYPRAGSVPRVTIPNTVGADGFSTGNFNDHVYNVYTDTRGMGLTAEAVGEAFRDNPTPGNDNPATPEGTPNNVGGIPRPVIWDNAYNGGNWVNSFAVPSPDPERFTDIAVNYTREGEHLLEEGYVMQFGVVEDGEVVGLRTYGEGHAWEQSEQLSGQWCKPGQDVWNQVHQEVIEDASAGID